MEIKKEEIGERLIFFIEENGKRVAEIVSRLPGASRIIVEHTEVAEALGGKGIGRKLVDQVVAYARERELKIVPMCSFTRSVFQRYPEEYKDVI